MHSTPSNDTSTTHRQADSQLAEATFHAPGLVVTIPSYELETLLLAKGATINWEAPSVVVFSDQVSCTHVVYPLSLLADPDTRSFFDPLSERIVKLNGSEMVLPLDAAMAAAAQYEGRSVIFDWDARRCLETRFGAPVHSIDLGAMDGERQLEQIIGSTLSRTLPHLGELELRLTERAQGIVCRDRKGVLDAVNAFALTEAYRDLNVDQLIRLYSILSSQELYHYSQHSTAHILDASMVLTPQTTQLVHKFSSRLAQGQEVITDYEHSYHTPFNKVLIRPAGSGRVTSDAPYSITLSFWKDGELRDLNIAERFGMQLQHHSVTLTATVESPRSGRLLMLDLNNMVPGLAQWNPQIFRHSLQRNKGTLDKEPCSFGGVPAVVSLNVSHKISSTREEPLSAAHYVGLGSCLLALVSPRTGDPLKIEIVIEFQDAWDNYSDEPRSYYHATRAAVQSAQPGLGHSQPDGDELGTFSIDELPAEMVLWPQTQFVHAREVTESQLPQQFRANAPVSLTTILARPTKAGTIDLATQANYVRQYKLRQDEVASSARNGDLTSLQVLFYLAEDGEALSRWSKKLLVDIVKGPTSPQFSAKTAGLILEKIDTLPRNARSWIFEHLLATPKLNWRPEPPGPWVTLLRDEVMREACMKLLESSQTPSQAEAEQIVSLLALTLPYPDVGRGFFRVLRSSPGGERHRLRDRLLADQLSRLRRGGVIFKSIAQPNIEQGTYALFLPGLESPIALDRNVNGYEYTGTLSLQFDEQGSCTTPGFRTSRPLTRSDCAEGESLPSLYIVSKDGTSIPFPFRMTEVVAISLLDNETLKGFRAHCRITVNSDWWSRDNMHPSPLLRGALIQRDLSSWGDLFPALHPVSGMQLTSFVPPLLFEEMEWRSLPQGERSRYGKRYETVLKEWQEAARHVPSYNPEGPLIKGIKDVYRYPLEQLAALRSSLMSPLHLHVAQEHLTLVTAATTFHLRFLPQYFSVDERTLYERLLNESISCADILLQQGAAPGMDRMMKFDAHLQVLRLQSLPYWHEESLDQERSRYIDFVGEVCASMKNNSLKGAHEAQRLTHSFRVLTPSEQLAALKTISDPLFSALYSSSGVSPRLSQYYADRENYLTSLMEPLSRLISSQAYETSYDEAVIELIQRFARAEDVSDLRFPAD